MKIVFVKQYFWLMALVGLFIHLPVQITMANDKNIVSNMVSGYVKPGFEPVYDEFLRDFASGKQTDAALCVYHKGEKVSTYYPTVNWWLLLMATILTSGIFTLLGIMINAGCNTVNQYMLKTIPYMLLFILPCFALLGFPYSDFFAIIPSVAALKLMLGAYHGISGFEMAALAIYLFAINYILLKLAVTTFEKRIVYQD